MMIVFKEISLEDAFSRKDIEYLTKAVSAEAWNNHKFPGIIPLLVETDYSQAFGFVPAFVVEEQVSTYHENELREFVADIISDMDKETLNHAYAFHGHIIMIVREEKAFSIDMLRGMLLSMAAYEHDEELWNDIVSIMPAAPIEGVPFWTDGHRILFRITEDFRNIVEAIMHEAGYTPNWASSAPKEDDSGWVSIEYRLNCF